MELQNRLFHFLRAQQVLTLAVMETEDCPYAAALFYAVDDGLRFYVLTDPATNHGRAMLRQPAVAGTVHLDRQVWHEIQGVQFRGVCRQLVDERRAQAWTIYTARFPFLLQPNVILTRALANTALWCIEPTWIRLIDSRLGFGHKDEWTPPPGQVTPNARNT
ncbi:MAG: hypothetical protein PCFJNLEI_04054 [Verrucomicrobiae bacterium]|nr:hypothetical protein [Verrucomicrobiae bacterium]